MKYELTPAAADWLRQNYPRTQDRRLCAMLGVSLNTLRRFKDELGLKKDSEYLHNRKRSSGYKAFYVMQLAGKHPTPFKEETYFRKGMTNEDRFGKERSEEYKRKAAEGLRRVILEEKACVAAGIPRRTRLKLGGEPRMKSKQRYYLKKRGYILDESTSTAYYNGETRRSLRLELSPGNSCYRFSALNN